MGPHAIALAEAEGLAGHAESVRVKIETIMSTTHRHASRDQRRHRDGARAPHGSAHPLAPTAPGGASSRCPSTTRRSPTAPRSASTSTRTPSPPVPKVIEKTPRKSRAEDLTIYPERRARRSAAVAAALRTSRPDQVLLTNGVDEAIHLLCATFLEEGRRGSHRHALPSSCTTSASP